MTDLTLTSSRAYRTAERRLTRLAMRNGTALLAASLALILSLLGAGCGQDSGPAEPEFDQPEYQTPFPVRITLDVRRRLGEVPRGLFGTNVEWIRNANGLWDPEAGELNETIVELSRKAGITLVRFPGGVWSDAYHWRDGVGPQEKRPATPHVPGDPEQSRHVVGTDEIAEFARRIGARLVLTANAGHGTAEEAGAWAAYVRDRHGADLVHLWEIGNELYMKDDMTGASIPPAEYTERVRDFAQAIRREIPNARIAAIGLKNYGRYNFNNYPKWNEIVLDRAGEFIDYLAVHNAYAPLAQGARPDEGTRVYRAMWAAPKLIARNLRETAKQIDQLAGQSAAEIKLAVTEWGPFFAIDPASPFFDHVKTLGSAVFVARALNVFLRDSRTTVANSFKLSDWLKMGWIGLTEDGGFRATPALSVLELYARGLAGELIDVELEGPVFSSAPTGFIDAVQDAPAIDAVASLRDDGQMVVLLSSAAMYRPATVTVVTGGNGGYHLTQHLLTGPAPDAHRATRMIEVPGIEFANPAPVGERGAMHISTPDSVPVIELEPQRVGATFEVSLPPSSVLRLLLQPHD
jgi:alpha-L-arabinofuranosidase